LYSRTKLKQSEKERGGGGGGDWVSETMFIRLTGLTCLSMRTHITLIDRDADNFAA